MSDESDEPQDPFLDWLEFHCVSTGDNARVRATLLQNRRVIADQWRATVAELCEVTERLVKGRRVPRFPEEVTNAIGTELIAIRQEAAAERKRHEPATNDCPTCAGAGTVTVPHPRCVWHGRLVLDPSTQRVNTADVICDEDGCRAGAMRRAAEPPRVGRLPTLGQFAARHHCTWATVVRMVALYDRHVAERIRRELGHGPLTSVVASIMGRIRDLVEHGPPEPTPAM